MLNLNLNVNNILKSISGILPFLNFDLTQSSTPALINGSGATGLAQKNDLTFQSFTSPSIRKTNRGLMSEPSSQNFVAYSSNTNGAGWAVSGSFASITAKTSIIPGGTAYQYTSDSTSSFINQGGRGSLTAGREVAYIIAEIDATTTLIRIDLLDQTNGNTAVVAMSFNFQTQVITKQSSTGTLPQYGFANLGPGPNGGTLWAIVMSGIPPTAGNSRRYFLWPNGSVASAGRSIILHHVQGELGNYATSPILNSSTTSNTRLADSLTISIPSGTYDVRYTTPDGTVNDRLAVSSIGNSMIMDQTATQNSPIVQDDPMLQFNLISGSISNIAVWQQMKNIHLLGDSYLNFGITSPYTVTKWFPISLYRPRVITIDGIGGTSLTQEADRFDLTPQYWGDFVFIVDGGLDTDLPTSLAAINRIVANLTGTKQWLYIQPGVDASRGAIGSQYYTDWLAVYTGIKAQFPNNCVDSLIQMQTHGDGSANDISDVANGWWPRSLRYDVLHPNNLGSKFFAQIMANAVYAKGY